MKIYFRLLLLRQNDDFRESEARSRGKSRSWLQRLNDIDFIKMLIHKIKFEKNKNIQCLTDKTLSMTNSAGSQFFL